MFKCLFQAWLYPNQVEWSQNSSSGYHPDNSNMNYYGETPMYLVSVAGNFNHHVALDKRPIHNVAWSPHSKQFGAIYGCRFALVFLSIIKSSCQICLLQWPLINMSGPFTTLVQCCTILSGSILQDHLLFLSGFCNLAWKINGPNTFYCFDLLMDVSFWLWYYFMVCMSTAASRFDMWLSCSSMHKLLRNSARPASTPLLLTKCYPSGRQFHLCPSKVIGVPMFLEVCWPRWLL